MVAYVDSSVVLRHVLRGEIAIEHALEYPRRVASELLEIESHRVIQQCRLTGTLDALHLATAQLVDAPDNRVAVFSHDDAMNRCARALGLPAPLARE